MNPPSHTQQKFYKILKGVTFIPVAGIDLCLEESCWNFQVLVPFHSELYKII